MEKVKINKDACIGCGACQASVPDVFEMNEEGLAEVTSETVTADHLEDVQDAADMCPTSAIIVSEDCDCGCDCEDECNCDTDCECGCQDGEACSCEGCDCTKK